MTEDTYVTYRELATSAEDESVRLCAKALVTSGNILADVPFKISHSLFAHGHRYEPNAGWTQINQVPRTSAKKSGAFEDRASIIRNLFQVDAEWKKTGLFEDPFITLRRAWFNVFSAEANYSILFNDPHKGGDVNAPVGLVVRLEQGEKFGLAAPLAIEANGQSLPDLCDRVYDYLLSSIGAGVHFYVGSLQWRRLVALADDPTSPIKQHTDGFGVHRITYLSGEFHCVGRKMDQSAEIIDSDDVYAVRLSPSHVRGWQLDPLRIKDLGLDPTNGVVNTYVIDWAFGLTILHPRSLVKFTCGGDA